MINKTKLKEFLDTYGIEYATSGKNMGNAVLGINCPICKNDTGHHLGIFDSGVYSCWKDFTHKGKIEFLLRSLTQASLSDIRYSIYGLEIEENLLDTIDKAWYNNNMKEPLGGTKNLEFREEFRTLSSAGVRPFLQYLYRRGFDNAYDVGQCYDLMCCPSWAGFGWSNRLIIPFYMNNKLITWIGRDISSNPKLRYKNLSVAESARAAKYSLWNYDRLRYGGRSLYIVEGIFDAMKIDYYTQDDTKAVPILTTSITDEQLMLLFSIENKYSEVIITLDSNAEKQALKLADQLSFFKNVKVKFIPEGIKDPGDMTEEEVNNFVYGDK